MRTGNSTLGLPGDLLPNGMPALPSDLQLDAPVTMPTKEGSAGAGFSAPQSNVEGSGFQGGLFTMPSQQSSSMWQQFGQAAGQQQAQQRAPPGLQQPQREQQNPDFNLVSKGSWGAPAVGGISPTSQAHLGAFGSGPQNQSGGPPGLQFGQVISGGFGAFVPTGDQIQALLAMSMVNFADTLTTNPIKENPPADMWRGSCVGKQPDWSANTGKQPDWSTTAVGKQPDWSTGSLNPSNAPAPFPAPMGLNAVASSSFNASKGPGNQTR